MRNHTGNTLSRFDQNSPIALKTYNVDKLFNSQNRLTSIATFLFIFVTNDTILFTTRTLNLNNMIYFVYICMLIYFLHSNPRIILKDKGFSLIILISIWLLFLMLVHNDFHLGYISRVIILLLMLYFSKRIPFKLFCESFSKILFFFAFVSIILFFIVQFIPLIDLLPRFTNENGVQYTTIYIASIMLGRNTSIFREPGVFGIYLTVAILIELYLNNEINYKRLIVFFFAVFTSYSTAAFITSLIAVSFYLFSHQNYKSYMRSISKIFFIVIFFIAFKYLGDSFQNKISYGTDIIGGYTARVSSVIVPIEIFLDKPFFGRGISQFATDWASYTYHTYGIPFNVGLFTNSITIIFASLGIVVGIFYLFGIYKVSKMFGFSRLVIFLILLLSFSNENLLYSPLYNLLVVYGITSTAKNY